jgi:hypothetical protein
MNSKVKIGKTHIKPTTIKLIPVDATTAKRKEVAKRNIVEIKTRAIILGGLQLFILQ